MTTLGYWVRWLRWFFRAPGYRMGDPALGSGEERWRNREILRQRYKDSEPERPK